MTKKRYAVILLNYNTVEDAVIAASSIVENAISDDYVICFVDGCSTKNNQVEIFISANIHNTCVLKLDENVGYARGNNAGVRYLLEKYEIDYLVIMNPDVEIRTKGLVDNLIDTLSELGAPRFEALLGDGSQYGIHLQYKVQPSPDGLAQAFILGEEFIGDDCCAMILGDNIFYGNGFSKLLKSAAANAENKGRCTVFGYYVQDPERFGIVEFDKDGKVLSVEEKPQHPKSNYAITGLYFYNKEVVEMAKQVKPSARGELEITTLNDMYLKQGELDVQLLGRGFAWLDTGTMDSLVEAADFVRMIEKRQGIKISAPEEIAFKYGWIDRDTLLESAQRYGKSPYGQHLKNVAEGKLRY